jgi:hypothetical protein
MWFDKELYNSIGYKKNFDNSVYALYKTNGDNTITEPIDRNDYILEDLTITFNNRPIGLIRLFRPKKKKIFGTLNWNFCQIWIDPRERNKGIAKHVLVKLIDKRSLLEYLIFSINRNNEPFIKFTRILGATTYIKKDLYEELNINMDIFAIKVIDVEYFKEKLKDSLYEQFAPLKESKEMFKEEYENDMLIIKRNTQTKQPLVQLKSEPYFIVPYTNDEKGNTKVLLVENNDIIKSYNNEMDSVDFVSKILNDILGIKIVRNSDEIITKSKLEPFDNIVDYRPVIMTIRLDDPDNFEVLDRSKFVKAVYIPISKFLKCTNPIKNIIGLKLLAETSKLKEMSVSGMASYESPATPKDKSKDIIRPQYPGNNKKSLLTDDEEIVKDLLN